MATVKGPLVYSEWTHNDAEEHALTLNIDFYCPKGWTCALVNEKGENVSGDKVEIKTIENPPKDGPMAEAVAFYRIYKDLSDDDELETVKVQQDLDGKWKDYAVSNLVRYEVRLCMYDWDEYQAHQKYTAIYTALNPGGNKEYIELAAIEAAIGEYAYDEVLQERLRRFHEDLSIYIIDGKEYLKSEDIGIVLYHIPKHVIVIIGGGE